MKKPRYYYFIYFSQGNKTGYLSEGSNYFQHNIINCLRFETLAKARVKLNEMIKSCEDKFYPYYLIRDQDAPYKIIDEWSMHDLVVRGHNRWIDFHRIYWDGLSIKRVSRTDLDKLLLMKEIIE